MARYIVRSRSMKAIADRLKRRNITPEKADLIKQQRMARYRTALQTKFSNAKVAKKAITNSNNRAGRAVQILYHATGK